MPDYSPSPIDISGIEVPESLNPVTEKLAEHVHDVWAQQRINEGWKFGPERNDERKEHPCLVKYDELPDEEKEYDRKTALNTLKVIMKMGYQIVQPEGATADEALSELARLAELEADLRAKKPISTRKLRTVWDKRAAHLWALQPGLFEILANTLLKRAYPLWANDVAREGLKISPGSTRLKQLQALAMNRSGSPRGARKMLKSLVAEGHRDSETLGLLASSYKTSWKSGTGDDAKKDKWLEKCVLTYREAFEETGDYFPGINYAAMTVVQGDLERGQEIAAEVRDICEKKIEEGERYYWILATVAEASLIQGKLDLAVELYREAVSCSPGDLASIAATRRQAIMLAEKLGVDDAEIKRALPVSPIATFAGLPCTRNGETILPVLHDEKELKKQFEREIEQSGIKIGYASATGAGDLAFLESVLEHEGEIHLVLPAPADDLCEFFTQHHRDGERWAERFKAILNQSSSITVVSRELGSADAAVFQYANRILAGASVLKSKSLGTPVRLIELRESDGNTPNTFPNRGIFNEFSPIEVTGGVDWGKPIDTSTEELNAEVKGILFADLKGYSKLPERQIPLYIKKFLAKAATLCNSEPGLQFRNTWGDAFYLVFDDVRTTALFAKELRSFIKDTDWIKLGFSQNFGIRIGLHAGPLFSFDDPILEKPTYSGQHTSRAARIEPITDEGQIFVSEPFACLAAEGAATDLKFEYLGRRALAKKYGGEGLFMLL